MINQKNLSILSFERGYSCEDKTYQQKSPLKQECEDSYFCNEENKMYGVCDGATPLVPFRDEQGHNGAYIASHLFASYFASLRENHSLPVAVAKANEALQRKMLEYRVDTRKRAFVVHMYCGSSNRWREN